MKNEKKKQKWAVLLDSCERLSKGNKVRVREIIPYSFHGGSCLENEVTNITIFAVKEVSANMLLVHADKADYYMYNYCLSKNNLCFPSNEKWYTDDVIKTGEPICFTRTIQQNNFKEECFTTNPVFKIDVIYQGLVIAWCKDRVKGDDIGYVVNTSHPTEATCGQYYWLWNTTILSPGEKTDAKITIDLAGEYVSHYIEFTPKSAKPIGADWSLIEGDDGNFYIRTLSMDYGWHED